MEEIWKDIKNYEGLYQISNLGNIKALPKIRGRALVKEKILKPKIGQRGYKQIVLSKNNVKKGACIHRLVAIAFIPNTENKPFINHKDGNKINNCVSNLEWCTCRENTMHALNMGLRKYIVAPKGADVKNAKLTKDDVNFIRNNFKRRDKEYGINALAKRFNVERHTITKVINRKTYKGE